MLKPQNRLRKMKDIEILFKEGRFVGGDLVNGATDEEDFDVA